METPRNDHEAYGLTEKRLGEIYKCKVRAMDHPSKIKALEQRSSYFEVAERLLGKNIARKVTGKDDRQYGKVWYPCNETMVNTGISSEGLQENTVFKVD